jgi:hypothetical protein
MSFSGARREARFFVSALALAPRYIVLLPLRYHHLPSYLTTAAYTLFKTLHGSKEHVAVTVVVSAPHWIGFA